MRILHVIPGLAKRYGGPSAALPPLIHHLRRGGLKVDIAATDADGASASLMSSDLPDDISDAYMFRRNYSEQWKISTGLWHWLNKHVSDYDIVHIHALWSFSTATATRACRKQNVPYIIRPAGMLSRYSWQHKGWKKHIYWNFIEKNTIRFAAAFHATSMEEEQDIKRLHPDARVFVIPNGVDDAAFHHPVETQWPPSVSSLVDGCDEPIILIMSRLHPVKGIDDRLLPAFAKMATKAHLLIVGDEDSHYPRHKAEIEKAIQKLNIADKVHLSDAIDGDDRWALFDMADLFVLPSHSENFGIVVAEAMARSCAVAVTRDVQSSPLVDQANAGVVVSGDIDELSNTLDTMVSDTEVCSAMGENGRRYAEKNLRWELIGRQIKSMYASVLS